MSTPVLRSLFVALTLALSLSQAALAQGANATLDGLEKHFFEHTYPGDTTDDRVSRLEKMVFGEAKSGDDGKRIADLQQVVTAAGSEADAQGSGSQGSGSRGSGSSDNSASSSSSGRSSNASASKGSDNGVTDDTAYSGTDYPRVDMLEEVILGQEYRQLSLKKRLVQLEMKVYGKPGTDDDLSSRTDMLEMHWQKTLSPSQQNQFNQDLTWLENSVIGQTYPQKPFIERVQTLEGIVFPNDHPDYKVSIKDQIATLVNAVHLSGQSGHPNTPSVTPIETNPEAGTAANYPGYSQGGGNSGGYSGYNQGFGGYNQSAGGLGNYQAGTQSNYQSQQPVAYNGYNAGYGGNNSGYGGARSYQASPLAQEYAQGGNYNTASGYPQPAHTYPGQPSQASYMNSDQYTQTTTNSAAPNTASEKQNKGHPLLKGLAKALGAAAGMAASAVGSMSMGYGMPYGYGAPMGMGMGMPYGYGGIIP